MEIDVREESGGKPDVIRFGSKECDIVQYTITVEYVPDKLCIELKMSLKIYFNSYRNEGLFYESATNKILDDLVSVCKPRYMLITAEFNVRGGISSVIEAEYYTDEFIK